MSYSGAAPAGWHPEPQTPGASLRWWDGNGWTEHVQAGPAGPGAAGGAAGPGVAASPGMPSYPPPAGGYGAGYGAGPGYGGAGYGAGGYGAGGYGGATPTAQPTMARANQASLTAMGVTVLYIVLAATSGVYFVGILPLMMAIRAVGRKEKLAPVAVVAAVLAIAVGVGVFRPH